MSIGNPEELRNVLSDPKRHAKAFSRHTYGMLAWVDLFGAGITAQELTVSLFKRRVVVYPGDGLGNVGATDYLRLNISRPDKFAFEKLRDSLSEAKSGVYRKKIINFFEKKSTERAKWIVQKVKERL
ncbi:MAG: hypothetical protein V3U54_03770 [Thermodesulfobacteriota bacterium]